MNDFEEEIYSLKEIATALNRPLAQVQVMDRAHVLGKALVSGAGARFYRKAGIDALAQRPRHTKESFVSLLAEMGIKAECAVILRQLDAQPSDSWPDQRSWYGFDLAAELSSDPAIRWQQDQASRMYWAVSAKNLVRARSLAPGQFIPLIISVGGLVVAAREIIGIDETNTDEASSLVAFSVKDAGLWFERVNGSWLSSGPGKPILWWDLPS